MLPAMRDRLSQDEVDRFGEDGFLMLDGWLEPALRRALIAETDEHEASRKARPAWSFPAHALLTAHPPLLALVEQLLGPGFLFHHVHAARHEAGAPGVTWHNDYEQVPQISRVYRELIVLVYPDGLRGEVGDLAMVPRTHGIVSDWHALSCFGTAAMPGEVVVDRLDPGAIVLADCGLLHCRRPRPGPGPRYFSDFSYCQRGIRWPAWSEGDWRQMYRELRARGGPAHLYDETQFFDQHEARSRIAALAADGSLADALRPVAASETA
jgi:hypothetical protein